MTEWMTVLEIEKATKIPNASVRRYIRHHGHHLNIRKKGKSYQIARESIEIMEKIRRIYEDGKTTDQVEESLINMGNHPITIDVTDDEQTVAVDAGEALQELRNEIKDLKQSHHDQMNELINRLDKQQEYIDYKLEERDHKLTQALNEDIKSKQEAATSHDDKRKGWLAKLFRK